MILRHVISNSVRRTVEIGTDAWTSYHNVKFFIESAKFESEFTPVIRCMRKKRSIAINGTFFPKPYCKKN